MYATLNRVQRFNKHASTASSESESSSDNHTTTPKKQGILRLAATPGTGQSVRFGSRLYNDGDESKISNSTANSSTLMKSQVLEPSEDAIEMSLGFIRSPRKQNSPEKDASRHHIDDESSNLSLDASPSLKCGESRFKEQSRLGESIDTIAMPSLEGYSNIEDVSLDYPVQDETTLPRLSRQTKASVDSFEDMSFNESFLQAEIELAKRCMEEDQGESLEQHRSEDPGSEATVLVRSQSEEEIENVTTTMAQGTPMGANSTHGSEYLSTRSQASSRSPTSTASQWNTPRSFRFSPATNTNEEAERDTLDTSATGNESPSAQRLQRRVSIVRSAQPSPHPSPLFARLKSLTNTPIKRSPLSSVVLPPGAFLNGEYSIASVALPEREEEGHPTLSEAANRSALNEGLLSSPSADSIINEIIRESDELDQVHSERSQVLLQWIQQAEEESEETQHLLTMERERANAALQEAEAAQSSLLRMKEEANQVEAKRSERLLEVEKLAAKLQAQLEGKTDLGEESQASQENAALIEREKRLAELEGELHSQKKELERMQDAQRETEAQLQREQMQREEEKQRQEGRLEEMKEHYEDREQEKETAYRSLQLQLEAIENSREVKEGDEEEERIDLHRQLLESRDEQKALQDALISAQKQIGALQGEEYKDSEVLQRARSEVAELQRQLKEAHTALQASREGEESARLRSVESDKKCHDLGRQLDEERAKWVKKHEQMESENDNLLQSLAEAEEHRRGMEDDFLRKRDVALEESKAREEQAFSLAEEMQGRLEKVEAKLQAMTTRTTMLEHEVGDRGLQIVKLEKAKDRLEEDNLNYSIALSSKQQELSLLKRNTNRSQRNTPASAVSAAAPRLSAFTARTSSVQSRNPLREIQAVDESENSLAPLQSGPTNTKTMRRKTMDVNTPSARTVTSSARVVGSTARAARSSIAMPPPPSTVKMQRSTVSPDEGTKSTRLSSQSSSQASQRSSSGISASLRSSDVHSRRSSSSSMTLQMRPSLSASIMASEGPMDISELQTDQEASKVRQRLQERSRDLQRARVPVSTPVPVRARSSVSAIPA